MQQTPSSISCGGWLGSAIRRIEADYQRSADTHLIPLPLPSLAAAGIDLYLKDESTHPTGSLKHRLARSLFLFGLCNGEITEDSTVVEASSGSTAPADGGLTARRPRRCPVGSWRPPRRRARSGRPARLGRRRAPPGGRRAR